MNLYIFDWDDTLVDGRDLFYQAFCDAGIKILREKFDDYDKKPGGLSLLYESHGLKANDRIVTERYTELCTQSLKFIPGAVSVIKKLKDKGKKLAVNTNTDIDLIHKIVKSTELKDYFDIIMGPTGDIKHKPHPDIINYILKVTGSNKKECVMIGDRDTDILSGKSAGVYTAGVLTGPMEKEYIKKAKPDIIINSLENMI